MHHSLRLYSRHRELFLRYYLFQARWTRLPLVGRLVRRVANTYGKKLHGAYRLTPGDAEGIVDMAQGLFLGACTCRAVFHNCDHPLNTEILVGLTRQGLVAAKPSDYREITKPEAKDILRQCHQRGLISTIVQCRQDFYAICNCCACCCVPLRLSREYGIGSALTRHPDIVQEFQEYQSAAGLISPGGQEGERARHRGRTRNMVSQGGNR